MELVIAEKAGNQPRVAGLMAFFVHRIDGLCCAQPGVEKFIIESGLRKAEQYLVIARGVVDRSRPQRDVVALEYLDPGQILDACQNVRTMNGFGGVSGETDRRAGKQNGRKKRTDPG